MSNVIDEKVVEMRFENSDFEKNAKQTMSTLEKLQKTFDITGTHSKALDELANATSKLDTKGLAGTVETIGSKFSALETIAVGALLRIGNQAVDAGEKLLKSFTVDNIAVGWDKFDEKTRAVGTLVSQGFDLSLVESQVEKLNWFTDETSYNLTDMIDNIGKFTAKGWGLTETTNAMEGIALWAAMSGQNAQKASMAMAQLAQVGAYVNKQDWNSIRTANMDTKEFRQTAIEAAKDAKTLTQVGENMFKTLNGKVYSMDELFGEGLAKGQWLTQDVLQKSFTRYATAVDQIYEYAEEKGITASEAIEELGYSVDEFGLKAFKAAQEARTWADVVGSVRDAVSTGWMKTFELIFGNYEEATELFTELANTFYEIFAEPGNRRNDLLESWKELGGRQYLIEGLMNTLTALKTVLDLVREAFEFVFPKKTAAELVEITSKFTEFTKHLILTGENADNFKYTMKGIFSIFKILADVVKVVLQTFIPFTKNAGSLLEVLLRITGVIGRFITGLVKWVEQEKILEKGMDVLKNTLLLVLNVVAFLVLKVINLVEAFARLQPVQYAFAAIKTGVTLAAGAVIMLVTKIKDLIATLKGVESGTTFMDKIRTFLSLVGTQIENLKNKIGQFFTFIYERFEGVRAIVDGFKELFSGVKDTTLETDGTPIEKLKAAFDKLKDNIEPAISKLQVFKEILTPSRIAAIALGAAVLVSAISFKKLSDSVSTTAKDIGSGVKKIGNFFGDMSNVLKKQQATNISQYAKQFAEAVAILAGSLTVLAFVAKRDDADLKKALVHIVTLGVVMTALSAVLSLVDKKSGGIQSAPLALLSLAGAVAVMASALIILNELEIEKIWTKIGILGAVGLELAALSYVLSRVKGSIRGTFVLLAFAFSVKKIVEALASLNDYPLDNIKDHLDELIIIIGLMGAIGIFASKVSLGSVVSILAVALIFRHFSEELEGLKSAFNPDGIKDWLTKCEITVKDLIIFGAALAGFSLFVGKVLAPAVRGLGLGIAGVAIAVLGMVGVAKIASSMTRNELIKGIGAVVVFGALIAVIEGLAGHTKESKMIQFAASIAIITGAMVALTALSAIIGMIGLKNLWQGGVALAALTVMIVLLEDMSGSTKDAKIAPIVALVTGLVVLGTALTVLSFVKWTSLIMPLIAIGSLMGIMIALLNQLSKVKVPSAKEVTGIIFVTTMIAEVAGALWLLSWQVGRNKDNGASLLVAMGSMVATIGMVILLVDKISNARGLGNANTFKGKCAVLLTVCGLLATVAGSLRIVSKISWSEMWPGLLSLEVVLGSLIGIIFLIDKKLKVTNTNTLLKKVGALGGLAVALAIVAVSLFTLSHQTWDTIGDGLGALEVALWSLVGVLFVLTQIQGLNPDKLIIAALAVVTLAGSFLAIAGGLKLLANENWTSIGAGLAASLVALTYLIGLAALLSAVQAAFAGVSTAVIAASVLALVGLGAVMLELGGGLLMAANAFKVAIPAFKELIELDVVKLSQDLIELSKGLSAIGKASLTLAFATAGFLAIGAALIMVAVAVDLVSIGLPTFVECLNNMPDGATLEAIGKGLLSIAIGLGGMGVAGAISVGVLTIIDLLLPSLSANLDGVGNSLTNASEGLSNFASGITDVGNAFTGINIGKMAVAMLELAVGGRAVAAAGMSLGASAPLINLAADAIRNLASALSAFGGDFSGGFTSAVSSVKTGISNIISAIKGGSNEVAVTVEEVGRDNGVKYAQNMASGMTTGTLTYVEPEAKKTAKAVTKATKDNLGADVGKKIGEDYSKGVSSGIQSGVKDLGSKLTNLFGTIKDSSKGLLENTFPGLSKWFGNINNLASDSGSSLKDFVTNIKDTALEATGLNDIGDQLTETMEGLAPAMDGVSNATGGAGKSAAEAKNSFKELTDTIGNQIDLFSEFEKKTDMTADKLLENMRSQVNGVADWSYKVASLADKGIDEGLLQKLAELGPQGYEYVNAFSQMTTEQLAEANVLFAQSLALPSTAAAMITDSYAACGSWISAGLQNGIDPNAGVTELQQNALNQMQAFKEKWGINSPSTVAYEFGKFICEGLRIGISNYEGSIKNQLNVTCASLVNICKARLSVGIFADIGKNITDGLSAGVSAGSGDVMAKVEDLCTKIKDKIKSAMETHSPSKFTERIGRYLDEGLALGVKNNTRTVLAATDNMADESKDSLTTVLSAITDAINGDLNYEPVIRPVLDLSGIRAGVSQINGMFESTRLAATANTEKDNVTQAQQPITYNQYNYSPQALSRIEIYRQTRNQLSSLKGMVNA